jgi:hypothetical protein
MNRSRPPGREHRLGRQLHHHNVVDVADDLAMLAFDDGADARLARGASTSVVCTLTTTLSFRFGGGTDEIGLSGNSGGKSGHFEIGAMGQIHTFGAGKRDRSLESGPLSDVMPFFLILFDRSQRPRREWCNG